MLLFVIEPVNSTLTNIPPTQENDDNNSFISSFSNYLPTESVTSKCSRFIESMHIYKKRSEFDIIHKLLNLFYKRKDWMRAEHTEDSTERQQTNVTQTDSALDTMHEDTATSATIDKDNSIECATVNVVQNDVCKINEEINISQTSNMLPQQNENISSSNDTNTVKKAQQIRSQSKSTIFDKILAKQAPADIIYEDDLCMAFNDIHPQAPVHFLVIPKKKIPMLEKASKSDSKILGKLLLVAKELGRSRAPNGFRLVINNGRHSCQSVYYLHIHVIGGRQLKWPPT
ncbi:histidine triad hit protein [Holotrichia oblita]|uniref:Histidine triad hit protein n=1 Tax=Holotrichia oblita TaxID=644536 RepID=A0ACB9TL00_HOLOL|nr:histidine triad hit protein [Holotrichia oblita]